MKKALNQKALNYLWQVGVVMAASAAPVFAQETAPDYATITAAVAVGGVVTAIVAMGAVKIAPNVAKWATNKLVSFF